MEGAGFKEHCPEKGERVDASNDHMHKRYKSVSEELWAALGSGNTGVLCGGERAVGIDK